MHDCCFHKCVRLSKRYSRQFSSSLLSEQSSSSSHLHMVGMHLLLLHWNCPSSHSVSVPVSVPENDSEENYSRVFALPLNPRQPATITRKERKRLLLHNNTWLNRANLNTVCFDQQLHYCTRTLKKPWQRKRTNLSFFQCYFRQKKKKCFY